MDWRSVALRGGLGAARRRGKAGSEWKCKSTASEAQVPGTDFRREATVRFRHSEFEESVRNGAEMSTSL